MVIMVKEKNMITSTLPETNDMGLWEQIKEELNSKGLITAEEKQFGIFQINNHHQIFLMGIDQTAKEKHLDEQEEKELAAEAPAPIPLRGENTAEAAPVQ